MPAEHADRQRDQRQRQDQAGIRPRSHAPPSLLRLLVARQHVVGAFPGRQEIEVAEFLRQLDRLVDDALLLVVVAHLDVAGQREILAQRMALEAVVGQQAAQVRMAGEQDAVHVVGLALEPVGAGKHAGDRRHRRLLVGRRP